VARRDGPAIVDLNPTTGKPLAEFPVGTAQEIDAAVTAARDAFDGGWRDAAPNLRRRLLNKLAQLVADNAQELGRIATRTWACRGRSRWRGDLHRGLRRVLRRVGRQARRRDDPALGFEHTRLHDHEPRGVVGAVVPWNAPLSLALWRAAPALAAGNTMVIKPSELAPLPILRLMDLIAEAGFPPGVVNCVTGSGPDTGAALVDHPGVDVVVFTGSTATGRRVAEAAGRRLVPVSLELGGKSANVVFADADLDAAAVQAGVGCFINTGQQCIAGSRLLVEESVHDEFLQKVSAFATNWAVGDRCRQRSIVGEVAAEPLPRAPSAPRGRPRWNPSTRWRAASLISGPICVRRLHRIADGPVRRERRDLLQELVVDRSPRRGRRLPAMHCWPVLMKQPTPAWTAAASRSASANTTFARLSAELERNGNEPAPPRLPRPARLGRGRSGERPRPRG